MQLIKTALGPFFKSAPDSRHLVCMSCREKDKPTLTPAERREDGDHEITDQVTLCEDCSFDSPMSWGVDPVVLQEIWWMK